VSAEPTTRSIHLPDARLAYRPQLDALRAFAVTAVVVQHALPSLGKTFPFAHAGVRLFFVLSGYLITTVLLNYRDATTDQSRWKSLGEFYVRRCLRIWPLYFLVIALALAFDAGPVREILPWLLTHTVNFCLAARGQWVDAFFHFWTLSIEEQFYFVWPLVVLFSSRRWLWAIGLALVAIGPLYRAMAVSCHWGVYWTYCPTPACLDTLGAGSLLAIVCHNPRWKEFVNRALGLFALPAGLVAVLTLRVLHSYGISWPQEVLFDLAVALVFVWLVRSAAVGFSGWMGKALEVKPAVYLGKISYGVYVYHVLLPYLMMAAFTYVIGKYDLESQFLDGRRQLALIGIALLIVPVLSWHFFEKPINGLKGLVDRQSAGDGFAARASWRRGWVALAAWAAILLAVGTSEGIEFWLGRANREFYDRRARDEGNEATGTVYYVSSFGDDDNPGTSPTRAWRSLKRISRTSFGPGDSILLEGGQTFFGGIQLNRDDAGTPAHPICIGSYGAGRATIDAGDGFGVLIRNTMGVYIHDLIVRGAGKAINRGSGIAFENDLPGHIKLPAIRVERVETSGFGKYGIVVCGKRGKSGYRGARIADAVAHDNALAGICISGTFAAYAEDYAHEDVAVVSCQAHDNTGIPGPFRKNSGSGIQMSDVNGGVVESCVAYQNGRLCNSRQGGPVGIWIWDANRIAIQRNESFRNYAGGSKDGGGFDLDGGVTNSVLQYNYSHDNDGPGLMLCQFYSARRFRGNTVRFNISQDDARKNNYGGIHIHDDNYAQRVENCEVYNNTVCISPSYQANPSALFVQEFAASSVGVRNNILQVDGGVNLLTVFPGQKDVVFQGNSYFSEGGPFKILWAETPYPSLAVWRTQTGQERVGAKDVGHSIDPKLQAPGKAGTLRDAALLPTVVAYRLRADSPLTDAGLDLADLFGIEPGPFDFFGREMPRRGPFSVGAHGFWDSRHHDIEDLPTGSTRNNNGQGSGAGETKSDNRESSKKSP